MPEKESMEYDVLLDIIGEVRMRKIQEISSSSDESGILNQYAPQLKAAYAR